MEKDQRCRSCCKTERNKSSSGIVFFHKQLLLFIFSFPKGKYTWKLPTSFETTFAIAFVSAASLTFVSESLFSTFLLQWENATFRFLKCDFNIMIYTPNIFWRVSKNIVFLLTEKQLHTVLKLPMVASICFSWDSSKFHKCRNLP